MEEKHLPWKFDKLEQEEEKMEKQGEAEDSSHQDSSHQDSSHHDSSHQDSSHHDFDPTKFILVDKDVIQKIDVMKSKTLHG